MWPEWTLPLRLRGLRNPSALGCCHIRSLIHSRFVHLNLRCQRIHALCWHLLQIFRIDSFDQPIASNWSLFHQPFQFRSRIHLSCPNHPRSYHSLRHHSSLGGQDQDFMEDLCAEMVVFRRYKKVLHTDLQSLSFHWFASGRSQFLVVYHLINSLSSCYGLPAKFAIRFYHHHLGQYHLNFGLCLVLFAYLVAFAITQTTTFSFLHDRVLEPLDFR